MAHDYLMSQQPWPMNKIHLPTIVNYDPQYADGRYNVELKYDGHRRILAWNEEGECFQFPKKPVGSPKVFQEKELPFDLWSHSLRNTVIDCELVPPFGEPASKVTHYESTGQLDKCTFYVHCVLMIAGSTMLSSTYDTNRAAVNEVVECCHNVFNRKATGFNIETAQQLLVDVANPTYDMIERSLSAYPGAEGVILKQNGTFGWFKYKRENTVDCIITGVVISRAGKFSGEVGSVKVSLVAKNGSLVEIAAAGGMSAKLRAEMSTLHEKGDLIGRKCEIKYQKIAQSRLRHPRFLRFRSEEDAGDCSVSQLKK